MPDKIPSLAAICAGQRFGIFAGWGVGKSTRMGMIAYFRTANHTLYETSGKESHEKT